MARRLAIYASLLIPVITALPQLYTFNSVASAKAITTKSQKTDSQPTPTTIEPINLAISTGTKVQSSLTAATTISACFGASTFSTFATYPKCSTTATQAPSTPSPVAPVVTYSQISCSGPPSNFDLQQVEQDLCSGAQYCDPPAAFNEKAQLAPSGDIQRDEIEDILSRMMSIKQVLLLGYGNVFSNGFIGGGIVAAGQMFEITSDRRFLNQAVRFADNILALQNDPQSGRVQWNGRREPVWPTFSANSSKSGYAGCEQGQIAGLLLDTALYILKNSCIWGLAPRGTSGLSNFPVDTTYYQRAVAYVQAANATIAGYLLPNFVDTDGLFVQPKDERWNAFDDIKSGSPMPYNRKSFIYYGLLRMAVISRLQLSNAPELTPFYDTGLAKQYEELVDVNVRDWVTSLDPEESCGKSTYSWTYDAAHNYTEKVRGIHAFYDLMGVFQAWQQNIAQDILTSDLFSNLANTLQYTVYLPAYNSYSAFIDGRSDVCKTDGTPVATVDGRWSWLAEWSPSVYDMLYGTTNGKSLYIESHSGMLWTRVAMARNSASFWKRSLYT